MKSTDADAYLAIVLKIPVCKPSRVARLSGGSDTTVGRVEKRTNMSDPLLTTDGMLSGDG